MSKTKIKKIFKKTVTFKNIVILTLIVALTGSYVSTLIQL